MRKIYLTNILVLATLVAHAQLPIVFYDFEDNSKRNYFQNVVEQYVNTGNSVFTRAGTSSIGSGTGAGVFNSGGTTGTALSVTNISTVSTDPGLAASSYIQFTANTSGFTGISLDFDAYSFGSGITYPFLGVLVSYNGGSSFVSVVGGFNPQRDVWSATTASFSSLADNRNNLVIRIYGYRSSNNSSGGFRVDNVTLYALGTAAAAGTKNMLNEEDIYTSNTSGVTGNSYFRKDFTATGSGTTVNLLPVKFTGIPNGTGATIIVSGNAVLNFNSGTLDHFIDSAHGTVPASALIVSGGTVNLNETLTCGGNINISAGSLLLNNETLRLGGTLTKTGGTFNIANGTLDLNGEQSQTIPAGAFLNNAVDNLVISNKSAAGVSLAGPLDVYGEISFTGTGKTLHTNDQLTLKSTATKTAELKEIPVNSAGVALNYVNGKITVERYISARKAWRFLSVPVNTTQTIKEAWQENQPANNTSLSGYGIQITGNMANWAANGFDLYGGSNAAIKTQSTTLSAAWNAVPNTFAPIKTNAGYMTFIRGDRTANAFNSIPTATVLRTTGTVYTGDQPPISVGLNLFTAVGNPFPSRLDLRKINKSAITDVFYVWDPQLGTMGGYQTMISFFSNYYAFPGGGSYNPWFIPNNYIESGQAFLMTTTSLGGNIILKENAKAGGSDLVSRSPIAGKHLITALYVADIGRNKQLVDITINDFDNTYNNTVDEKDIQKLMNINESLSLKTGNDLLVADRRNMIAGNDTIFFNLAGVRQGRYQLEFLAQDMDLSHFTAFLEDSYTNTATLLQLSDTMAYAFRVNNNPGSYNPDRFRIVFKPVPAVSEYITLAATRNSNATVSVQWKTENEKSISYEVQHSTTGNNFEKIASAHAIPGNGTTGVYDILHTGAVSGYNYYRVKAIGAAATHYSAMVKVEPVKEKMAIEIVSNPITNNAIQLLVHNMEVGKYKARLISAEGRVFDLDPFILAQQQSSVKVEVPFFVRPGVYRLSIIAPSGQPQVISIAVL